MNTSTEFTKKKVFEHVTLATVVHHISTSQKYTVNPEINNMLTERLQHFVFLCVDAQLSVVWVTDPGTVMNDELMKISPLNSAERESDDRS